MDGRDEEKPRHRQTSVGSLLSDTARNFSLLVRQEIALAKKEVLGKFGQLGTGAGLLAAGGALAYAGLFCLLAAAIAALAYVLPVWAAALVIGAVVLVVSAVLALAGRSRMRADTLVPQRTLHSLKEDAEWARTQVK